MNWDRIFDIILGLCCIATLFVVIITIHILKGG